MNEDPSSTRRGSAASLTGTRGSEHRRRPAHRVARSMTHLGGTSTPRRTDSAPPRTETSRTRRLRHQRRIRRLRRSIGLLVGLLLAGTVVARVGAPRPQPATAPVAAPSGVGATSSPTSPATAPATTQVPPGAAAARGLVSTSPSPTSSTVKPAGWAPVDVVDRGTGRLAVLEVPAGTGRATGRIVRFTVEAEGGINVDTQEFARIVESVLHGSRGWEGVDGVRFVNLSPADVAAGRSADVRVTLASPTTTNALCAPQLTGVQKVSCSTGHRAIINLYRWMSGSQTYGTDLASYRTYVINHEVGHLLGHGHEGCPKTGTRAPIMVQQTKFLLGCTAWPYPARS